MNWQAQRREAVNKEAAKSPSPEPERVKYFYYRGRGLQQRLAPDSSGQSPGIIKFIFDETGTRRELVVHNEKLPGQKPDSPFERRPFLEEMERFALDAYEQLPDDPVSLELFDYVTSRVEQAG